MLITRYTQQALQHPMLTYTDVSRTDVSALYIVLVGCNYSKSVSYIGVGRR